MIFFSNCFINLVVCWHLSDYIRISRQRTVKILKPRRNQANFRNCVHKWSIFQRQCSILTKTNSITCIHTYIIAHYNPSVRIIDLVFHITYVVCVNFIYKGRDLQFKVNTERQIFWDTFQSQSFCQKSAERKSLKKYFLYFGGSNPGFTPNKPTHYLLDYGDGGSFR